MCYRYSIHSDTIAIESRFEATFQQPFEKKYHVGAFDQIKLPVITDKHPKHVQLFSWGLIPFWVKNQQQAEQIQQKTANARAETIYEKPSFCQSAKEKHCLVLVDGFFEWQYVHGRNYPYYIRLKTQEPFALAGLWDTWTDTQTNETTNTYCIITCEANPLMAKIHNKKKRMPVILPKELEKCWIQNTLTKQQGEKLLVPYDQEKMEAYTISKRITLKESNPNVPEILNPYVYPELQKAQTVSSDQKTLF